MWLTVERTGWGMRKRVNEIRRPVRGVVTTLPFACSGRACVGRHMVDRGHEGLLRAKADMRSVWPKQPQNQLLEAGPFAIRMQSFSLKPVRPTDRCLSSGRPFLLKVIVSADWRPCAKNSGIVR